MLLFGSFSEDETKSLLQKQSSGNNEKPVKKNELQFGSLNSVIVKSSNLPKSPKTPNSTPPADSQKLNGVNSVSHKFPEVSASIKENGSITISSVSPSSIISANQVKENEVHSASPIVEDGTLNKFTNLSLDASEAESVKNVCINGNGDDSSYKLADQDVKKAPNGHAVMHVKDLLPRGLVNSGNLCFLNSTVQALLACSPFVQLLQELRTRNVPKVSLSAAAYNQHQHS